MDRKRKYKDIEKDKNSSSGQEDMKTPKKICERVKKSENSFGCKMISMKKANGEIKRLTAVKTMKTMEEKRVMMNLKQKGVGRIK